MENPGEESLKPSKLSPNATLSEYHGNTADFDGNPEDQMKVLFADSAKIRAFVSFRNVIVEIVLKGRSKKEGVSTTSSSSDGELTDDVFRHSGCFS